MPENLDFSNSHRLQSVDHHHYDHVDLVYTRVVCKTWQPVTFGQLHVQFINSLYFLQIHKYNVRRFQGAPLKDAPKCSTSSSRAGLPTRCLCSQHVCPALKQVFCRAINSDNSRAQVKLAGNILVSPKHDKMAGCALGRRVIPTHLSSGLTCTRYTSSSSYQRVRTDWRCNKATKYIRHFGVPTCNSDTRGLPPLLTLKNVSTFAINHGCPMRRNRVPTCLTTPTF